MIPRVKSVIPLPNYRIEVTFKDGATGIVDIAEALGFKGVFAKLRDTAFFNRVHVGRSSRTVQWSNQLDLDPVVLYHRATGKSIEWILALEDPNELSRCTNFLMRLKSMSEICRFYGITIAMRFSEHPPPHFHVEYSGQQASFRIDNLETLEGSVTPRARRLVKAWAHLHRAELMDNWQQVQAGKKPQKIKPLE